MRQRVGALLITIALAVAFGSLPAAAAKIPLKVTSTEGDATSINLAKQAISWADYLFSPVMDGGRLLARVQEFNPKLARLQTIPAEHYEAAAVDGAGAWQRFWRITLPQLRTILLSTAATELATVR